jgi:uncharacterized phage protein (TIGR02216 family)
VLRLSPDIFWRMSLVEWRAVMDGRFGGHAPSLARNDLQNLMRIYPDG